MSYNVEKNIPLKGVKTNIFPFNQMNIGDSFLIPKEDYETIREITMRQNVYNHAGRYSIATKSDFKITTKKTKDGLRVWRIK